MLLQIVYVFIFGVLHHSYYYCVRFNIIAFVCSCTYFVSSLCAAFCINILYPNRFNTNTHTNLLHYRTNGRERESSSRRRCWHDDEQKTNVVLEPSAAGFKERRPSMQPPLPTSLLFCASSSSSTYNGRSRIENWNSPKRESESRSENSNRSGSSSYIRTCICIGHFPIYHILLFSIPIPNSKTQWGEMGWKTSENLCSWSERSITGQCQSQYQCQCNR